MQCISNFIKSFDINNLYPRKLRYSKARNKVRNFRIFTTLSENNLPINISGSAQFNTKTLELMLKKIKKSADIPDKKIIIIDLRQEPHGYINGEHVTWNIGYHRSGNIGKSLEDIQKDEQDRLNNLPKKFLAWKKFYFIPYITIISVSNTATEKEMIGTLKNKNICYKRIPVTDFCRPTDQAVDKIVKLIKKNGHNWLHFHCAVGKGRTTTAMALVDMIHNAKYISCEEILSKQREIGGENLLNTKRKGKENPQSIERRNFLENFYQYCKEGAHERVKWSEWVRSNKIQPKDT